MSDPTTAPVLAAGAVLWRDGRAGVEVLLISRSRHDDISLPKGKLDPGETLPVAAVREIQEETGFSVALGLPLGYTEYLLPNGRDKFVYYWAAEVTREQLQKGRFRPNDEVDKVEWLSIEKAKKRLTYSRDAEVLDRFRLFVERDAHKTFAVIALRHAKAAPDSPDGTDSARPLTARGKTQAEELGSTLSVWSPTDIVSSTARRCVQTVTPLSKRLQLDISSKRALSQDYWETPGADGSPQSRLRSLIAKRIDRRATVVMCTHSPVLPPVIDTVADIVGGERDGRLTRAAILSTAEYTVLHLSSADPSRGIVAVETHSPTN
ncbi:NUDIX domain-containing protein [Amnibacterium flavum]|uniref:DNA mismatch repair protein MutT n=1 Tax=Amnibacterium flavum TaxID=2173173 RepID=A0A2V1HWS0_9MICO|nr:NUDIX domain-containing protein [Amnibacterium flavum]PVZ94977.1 DNA mismatch repair protein MutT [Amnibacterium flavum]